jgi:ketosteroid isomerase-like protein
MAQSELTSEELVRRAFEAIHHREMDVILEMFTEDAYFLPMTGTRVESGGYSGHTGIREYFEEMADVWEEMHPYANEVRDLGNSMVIVIGGCEVRGRGSGAGADTAMAWLQEIRDGRIASHRAFANPLEAYDAYEAATGDAAGG